MRRSSFANDFVRGLILFPALDQCSTSPHFNAVHTGLADNALVISHFAKHPTKRRFIVEWAYYAAAAYASSWAGSLLTDHGFSIGIPGAPEPIEIFRRCLRLNHGKHGGPGEESRKRSMPSVISAV